LFLSWSGEKEIIPRIVGKASLDKIFILKTEGFYSLFFDYQRIDRFYKECKNRKERDVMYFYLY